MDTPMMSDCRAALSRLYEYIDRELTDAERETVAAHLEACRPCLSRFEYEEMFREYVVRRAPRPAASAEFKARLMARLARAGESPADAGAEPQVVRFAWRRFAVAAVIILALGTGTLWMSQQYGIRSADWQLLAAYHHEMVEVEEDGIETADFSEARAFIVSRLGADVDAVMPLGVPDGVVIHEACVEPWAQTRLAHLEFETEFSDLSLFMLPASAFPMTDEPQVDGGWAVLRTATMGCCRAVCWEDKGGYVCVLVGDCELPRLMALAKAWHEVPGKSIEGTSGGVSEPQEIQWAVTGV